MKVYAPAEKREVSVKSSASRPIFGDADWLRRRGFFRDLPGQTIVTIEDALDMGFCKEGIQDFARIHFNRRRKVTVLELAKFADESSVALLLDLVWTRQLCRFCGRIAHAVWCIHATEER